jgi:hypothetical protein
MRVIVAHSLRSYRQAISAALEGLRPNLHFFTVEPEDLDEEFRRLAPHFVICSRVTDLVEREALGWIELYPEHASESVVSLCGQRSAYPEMDLEALLSILDEAERLCETVQKQL